MKRMTLRTARERRKLSIGDLARLTGGRVSKSTICRIERGTTKPLYEHIRILEQVLDTELTVRQPPARRQRTEAA